MEQEPVGLFQAFLIAVPEQLTELVCQCQILVSNLCRTELDQCIAVVEAERLDLFGWD